MAKVQLRKSFGKPKWARKVTLQGVGADLFASVGCRSAVKLWSLSGVHRIAKLSLSSTLAVRQRSKLHRSTVPKTPVGLLPCQPPETTRRKQSEPTTPLVPTPTHRRRSGTSCRTRPSAERLPPSSSSGDGQTA